MQYSYKYNPKTFFHNIAIFDFTKAWHFPLTNLIQYKLFAELVCLHFNSFMGIFPFTLYMTQTLTAPLRGKHDLKKF